MEDETILDLYFAREERAIAETGKKYGGYCRAIAHNILRNREDTEECVSDTWLHAWNAMPPQRPSILSSFLGRITRNLSFDRCRRQNAEKRGGGGNRAAAAGIEVRPCFAVQQLGRYDDYLRDVNKDLRAGLDESDIAQAGLAIT